MATATSRRRPAAPPGPAAVGDEIVVRASGTSVPGKTGTILAVLGSYPREVYLVRWRSGQESVYRPCPSDRRRATHPA